MLTHGRALKSALALALALATLTGGAAFAVEPIPSDVSIHDLRGYRGDWHITATMKFGENEREIEFYLMVKDVNGQAGALIDSTQQAEPIPVEQIALTETGVDFSFEMQFGEQSFPMIIHAKSEEERLIGTITDTAGLFNLEFEGVETDEIVQGERPNPTSTRISVGQNKYKITFEDLDAAGEDYKGLAELAEGDIFTFVGGRASKFTTDTDVDFGGFVAKYANVADNYPGVYGLWLKKTGDGWALVFNEEPDIWGTQHRADADAGEVPLSHSTLTEPQEHFLIELNKADNTGGTLRIAWGEHEWTTDFTVSQ